MRLLCTTHINGRSSSGSEILAIMSGEMTGNYNEDKSNKKKGY